MGRPSFSARAIFRAEARIDALKSMLRKGYPQQLNSFMSMSSTPKAPNTARDDASYWVSLAGIVQPKNNA
jgi:hypothetical protein